MSFLQAGGMPAPQSPEGERTRQQMHDEHMDQVLDRAEKSRPDLKFEEAAADIRRRLSDPELTPQARQFLRDQQDILYGQRFRHAPPIATFGAVLNSRETHEAAVANDRARRERQEAEAAEQRAQIAAHARGVRR
jgi:hypothetical protein